MLHRCDECKPYMYSKVQSLQKKIGQNVKAFFLHILLFMQLYISQNVNSFPPHNVLYVSHVCIVAVVGHVFHNQLQHLHTASH